jgi:hypothetical protein
MNEGEQKDLERFARRLRYSLAMLCVILGILHIFCPDRIDEKVAMFLGLALIALVGDQISKFKGFGIEYEVKQLTDNVKSIGQQVKTVGDDVRGVDAAFGGLEKAVGRGSKSAMGTSLTAAQNVGASRIEKTAEIDEDDPNKGQFGGSPESNGRKLSATIRPDAGPRSARCRVHITVVSIDSTRPLAGKVRFHLHPTFGRWATYIVDVKNGVAEHEIVSYGAFTIGAETDDGKVRLELDLVDVPGGTKRFYEE